MVIKIVEKRIILLKIYSMGSVFLRLVRIFINKPNEGSHYQDLDIKQ
ncbi:MAG: hypothetical protein ACJAYR_001704 [Sneathiella sp.]|jgi:hypothetical protein